MLNMSLYTISNRAKSNTVYTRQIDCPFRINTILQFLTSIQHTGST